MGNRFTWFYNHRTTPKLLIHSLEYSFNRGPPNTNAHNADGTPPSELGLRLPIEIWLVIIETLASTDTGRRHGVAPLTQVCKALSCVAEDALYRRVSVGPRLSQLYSFLHSVCKGDRRATAVRALRMQAPEVISRSVRSAVLQKLAGYSTYTPSLSDYNIDAGEMRKLSDLITQVLARLINLKELDFSDLRNFPGALALSPFQLIELKTTGDALLTVTTNSPLRTTCHDSSLEEHLRCPSPLVSVEKLEVDLFDPSLHLVDTPLLSITHLFLDRCVFVALPELRRSLSALPNLLSLRIRWSAAYAHHDISTLWPTHVLGNGPLPCLRRLQVCEWADHYTYDSAQADFCANAEAHLKHIKDACPNIILLAWWPSEHHRGLATAVGTRTRFGEALRRYTEGLFAIWPTLKCFERLKLEVGGGFTAFTRGQDGGVVEEPSVYCEGLWKHV